MKNIICVILGVLVGLYAGIIMGYFAFYKDGQIDALRGHQKYKMEITYKKEVKDTTIFSKEPCDEDSVMVAFSSSGAIVDISRYKIDTFYKKTIFVPIDTTYTKIK